MGDSYIVKSSDGIRLLDGMSELKRYWTNNIFQLPVILFNGSKKIVDMELFTQLFFVGQDAKDTSNIFNSGYYHKEDFKNMILSYCGDFPSEITSDEIRKLKDRIKLLKIKRKEQLKLSDFYKATSSATEYLSKIKDKDEFDKHLLEMEKLQDKISTLRKKRNNFASKRVLWNGTLKELRSLNRDIEVGELRCMDCNSTNIAYQGKGKSTYSFDVSTPEIRSQIIASIEEKILGLDEDISRCDFEIQNFQFELNEIMQDDDITIENIVAHKIGFRSVSEIEAQVIELDNQISKFEGILNSGVSISEEVKQKQEQFYKEFIDIMNKIRIAIDSDSDKEYTDLFTKRGAVISGSEETVFYVSRLITIAKTTGHVCPIIMDSFRAEDLSTDKEARALDAFLTLNKQCILTTTLKAEEKGKYDNNENIHIIDYTDHSTNKLLSMQYLERFNELLQELHLQL